MSQTMLIVRHPDTQPQTRQRIVRDVHAELVGVALFKLWTLESFAFDQLTMAFNLFQSPMLTRVLRACPASPSTAGGTTRSRSRTPPSAFGAAIDGLLDMAYIRYVERTLHTLHNAATNAT